MPPKERVSRVMVLDAAFEMTRECGFENVTARKLAQRLGSSTQPIFRAYENMEMLQEKFLFKLIADIDEYDTGDIHEFLQQGDVGELLENLPGTEKLTEETKKEVFRMVWMFTHGVATLVVSRRVDMDEGEIESMLKKAYEGFVKIS